jgi:hypothetical protein
MVTLYLNEETKLKFAENKILNEDFNYEDFKNWLVRKIKGYSVAEVDALAKKVKDIDSHESKLDTLNAINDAIKANTEAAAKTTDVNKKNYIKANIEALNLLKTKANEFSIVDKSSTDNDDSDTRVVKIDRYT